MISLPLPSSGRRSVPFPRVLSKRTASHPRTGPKPGAKDEEKKKNGRVDGRWSVFRKRTVLVRLQAAVACVTASAKMGSVEPPRPHSLFFVRCGCRRFPRPRPRRPCAAAGGSWLQSPAAATPAARRPPANRRHRRPMPAWVQHPQRAGQLQQNAHRWLGGERRWRRHRRARGPPVRQRGSLGGGASMAPHESPP